MLRTIIRPTLSRAAILHSPAARQHRVRFESSKVPPKPTEETAARHARLQHDWIAPLVHYETVKQWSQSPSPDRYLVDVREPDETMQGTIPGAVTLPLSGMARSLHLNKAEFVAQHGYEKPRSDQEIIFYCRSGKRSQSACDVARRNGFTSVKSYDGSWLDWVKREQPTR